ncbi:MAG: asparagine synthase (glutamine-hydrolyzing) [Nitrospiraceae bacterium]|nr:MAG: asparagine synthase (glutamine-hydrolyzing) [Nitrospiraceae bacterium]
MCGIFGILFREKSRVVKKNWVSDVIDTMSHRGPDDQGVFTDGNIGLGHRRLNIIDLSAGPQPVFNEKGDVCVVFNGEIYNFGAVRAELQQKGHVFRTNCDTEVIVHAYEEWGRESVSRLRGMFAFAVYDGKRKRLFLARDRLGIKPLYFYEDADAFIFASEIKPILRTGLVSAEVNHNAVDFYMSLGYVPAPETGFKNIFKLEPGHCMSVDEKSANKSEYWRLEPKDTGISFNDASIKFKKMFSECVESHLMSDVPLGVFLSGGLDSSAVVGVMSRNTKTPVKTFSVGYKNAGEFSELEYARKVAGIFKTEHHEFILEPGDFFGSINTFLHYSEEPVVESAAIALYQLSKVARSHVTVLLSGEGADELFGGYPLYWKMKNLERLHDFFRFVPAHKTIPFFNMLPEKYQKYLYWISVPFASRYKTVPCDVVPSMTGKMYTDDFRKAADSRLAAFFEDAYRRLDGMSMLQKMLYIDTKYWLPDDLLLKADKMTMATSVELRVPFLDHEFVEFAFSLPDDFKVNNVQGKLIFKKAVEDLLPHDIIYRQKKGFPVPMSRWFSGDLHKGASDILLDPVTINRGYFSKDYLRKILLKHKQGGQDLSRRIFSLLVFEMWHRMYIDEAFPAAKKHS